jgi:hypothetical protein
MAGYKHSKPGPEKGSAYGAASVAHALHGVDFPITKNNIMKKYGDRLIEFKKGEKTRLKDVLNGIEGDEFNSLADLEHALHEKLAA